jgi:hypothetical protein
VGEVGRFRQDAIFFSSESCTLKCSSQPSWAFQDVPGIFILGIEPTDEHLQKRVVFWLGRPRKAKRCDTCYAVALSSVFDSGRLSLISRNSPCGPPDDDIYKLDMVRSMTSGGNKKPSKNPFQSCRCGVVVIHI